MMTVCARSWLSFLVLIATVGCASGSRSPTFLRAPADVEPAAKSASAPGPPTDEAAKTAATAEADKPADEVQRLIAELNASGAIGVAEQEQLAKDLAQCDPALRPQMLQLFRTSLAYRAKGPAASNDLADTAPVASPETIEATAPPTAAVADKPQYPPSQKPAATAAVVSDEKPAQPATEAVVSSEPDQPPAAVEAPSAVQVATHVEAVADRDWQVALTESIVALEKSLVQSPADSATRQARLRLLYLAAGRRDDALRPLDGCESSEQQFYSGEMFGLSAYLNPDRDDRAGRAAEAQTHLRQALDHLGQTAPLVVQNLAFCTEVTSYGVYVPFAKHEFKPGQQVLLYVEVENLANESTPRGHHTALKSSFQVLDAQGRRVEEHELPPAEEDCKNLRRDYFIRYFLNIPERLYDGRYTLHLTIEDQVGKKVGQSSIEFGVVGKPSTK